MSNPTREKVMEALLAKVAKSSKFETASRFFQYWDNVPPEQKPAIFLLEREEQHIRGQNQTPARRILPVDIFIYITTGQDQSLNPITTLNNLIDAIDPVSGGVLQPTYAENYRQTLGGLVADCFIEGKIIKDAGYIDGFGVAVIPVKIIFN